VLLAGCNSLFTLCLENSPLCKVIFMQGPINKDVYMQEILALAQDYAQAPSYHTVKKISELAVAILHDYTVYGRPEDYNKHSWRDDAARDE